MKNKIEELFYEFLNVCSMFVGYELNSELEYMLTNIFDFICKILKISNKEKIENKKLMLELFSINKYSDYLLTKTKYVKLDDKLLWIGTSYFNLLSKQDNFVAQFNKTFVKKKLDELSLLGNVEGINLKAYLKYLGIIYEKNIDEAIELFRISAYSNDYFSFNVLSVISNDKEYYLNIYKSIKKELNFYDYKEKNIFLEILMESHKKTHESKKINYDMINYIFNSNESNEIKLYKMKRNLFNKNNIKIGF